MCTVFTVRAGVLAKMLGVLRREKCALMMVEPPGYFWRVGIFEINDRIFIAIEDAILPRRHSPVGHAAKSEFSVLIEALTVKAVKQRSRSRAVKTSIVEAKPCASHDEPEGAFLSWTSRKISRAKPFTMRCGPLKVKWKRWWPRSGMAIDIGKRSPAVPVTSPYVRVRIRRFGRLSYRRTVKGGIPSEAK